MVHFGEISRTFAEYAFDTEYAPLDFDKTPIDYSTPIVKYRKGKEECPLVIKLPFFSAAMQSVTGTRESYPFHLFTTQMTGDGKNYFLIKEKKYAKIPLSRYSAYFLSFSAEQHITKAEKETSLMDLQTVLSPDDPDITAVKAWIKKTYPEGNVTFGAVKFDGNLRKLYNKSKEGLMEEYKDRAPENTEGIIKRWKRTK